MLEAAVTARMPHMGREWCYLFIYYLYPALSQPIWLMQSLQFSPLFFICEMYELSQPLLTSSSSLELSIRRGCECAYTSGVGGCVDRARGFGQSLCFWQDIASCPVIGSSCPEIGSDWLLKESSICALKPFGTLTYDLLNSIQEDFLR